MLHVVAGLIATLLASMQPATSSTTTECWGTEKQTSGYIDLPNRVDTHYFYWYFESRKNPGTDPLIVWIPGGPGEGGTYGLLAENGPCTINDDLSTTFNAHSWTSVANMVWLDLPGNAVFSYSTTAEDDEFTDERVDESVFWFLQGFLKKHSELQGRELFLVGESYGGHFVASVASYILTKQGKNLFSPASAELIAINLQGVAIGNGLIDPVEVFTHFVNMTSNTYNITLVNDSQLAAMEAALPHCRDLMTRCQTNTSICAVAGLYCQQTQLLPLLRAHRNPYDIRQECQTSISNATACMLKVPNIKAYLDLPEVRGFLGVHPSHSEWILLNRTINAGFFAAPSYSGYLSVGDKLSNLLNIGLRVLLYAGDADILCNIYATEATAKKLKWSGAPGFNAVQERPYLTSSGITDAGSVQSYSHLTFVKVHEAGHMVPGDQPKLALDMITKFIHNQTF
ncbi:hypothetical protein PF005_g20184 [Phytophthora fragariae]|uniref:Carboxypeptidase n=1 Tax=Phytophthora fragariae TaxID=53985 RepID=A0A6A3SLR1_9STRA|nr:hypothetical protein PF003_g415 [Phytophthora fragariae]KAE8928746.1 hypothetical protein PF009_g21120 [Phytophthora fragariae]KAE9088000.1 hypothetical protein PF010_g19525 [Phytophthora fragariae]KAE9116171.1 hypothetical protein PF006_g19101 [Phytophthora fragariae]KAE9188119.1 hypothetical protein PF005_g20184 [Phytophthora fragariae]